MTWCCRHLWISLSARKRTSLDDRDCATSSGIPRRLRVPGPARTTARGDPRAAISRPAPRQPSPFAKVSMRQARVSSSIRVDSRDSIVVSTVEPEACRTCAAFRRQKKATIFRGRFAVLEGAGRTKVYQRTLPRGGDCEAVAIMLVYGAAEVDGGSTSGEGSRCCP